MEQFQTSFIPKKPITLDTPRARVGVDLFSFFGALILVASLIAAGGVFFYKSSIEKDIQKMDSKIAGFGSDFNQEKIAKVEEMQKFDRRAHAAETILANHIMISPIFLSLENLTLKSVGFTKFNFTRGASSSLASGAVLVTMSGKAKSYDSIALESDQLVTNTYFKNPIFSNLNLDEIKNIVSFDLSFGVDPSFINYTEWITREKKNTVNMTPLEQIVPAPTIQVPNANTVPATP